MATIYSTKGKIIIEGLPSSIASDEALKTAQRITEETQKSVIVEDIVARQLYRVSIAGEAWPLTPSLASIMEEIRKTPRTSAT
jgi:hypothetical protein